MHSSWPFFGATSGLRQQQQQPTAADFGDRPRNGNGSFALNSFVRSVNRHGARLPVGFQFRGLNCNDSKNGSTDRNARKSAKELLTLINDTVDRVDRLFGCNPEVRSNASSFASFRSGAEEKDPAALNDLIDLVSSTANEFRDINAGNPSSQNSPLNVDLRAATSPKNPPEVGLRTLVHPDVGTPEESPGFPVAEPAFPVWAENSRTQSATESASLPTNPRRRNRQFVDGEATTDDVLAYPPELVEIYSENRTAGSKRAQLSAESLETLRQFETPRYFPGQVLRLATAAGFSGTLPAREPSRRDWAPRTKRINFEDELWPVGPCIPGSRDFLPYFTGAPARAFRCRGAERSFANDERTMNASRSSPIFAGAGEAPAEATETVPTRDGGDYSRESGIERGEVFAGSSGDRATPLSIGAIGFPDSGSFYDASPTKLDKSEAKSIDGKKFEAEEAESSSPEVEPFASSVAEEEDDEASAEGCKGGDQVREPRACVKFPTKRTRRVCKQLKKPGRKSTASTPKRDDEDNSGRETSSTSQSPVRRSSPRFLEASPGSGEERREDERMGSVKGEDDSIETQVGMSFEIGGRRRFMGKYHAGRFRAVAKSSEMAIAGKNNLRLTDLRNFFAEDRGLPVMAERPKLADLSGLKRSSLGANHKNRLQNSPQPIWKPAGSVKVVPSSSSCSMARQSKIARLSISGSDSRGEKPKERFSTTGNGIPVVGKNRSQGFAKGPRGPAKSSEAQRSRSKQRPGTPRKASHTGIAEDARSEDKSRVRESFLSSESTRKTSSAKDKLSGPGSICKTAIPVLRSKTFVHQTRPEAPLRRVVSREDHTKNPKLISARSLRGSRNSATSGPAFDTPFDSRICADAEKSHSDFVSREDHTKNPKLISARSSRSSRNSATSGPAFDTPFDSRICTDAEKSHSDFVSREDHTKNPKLISARSSRSSRNSATSGPAFDTPFDSRICTDAEKSHSDFVSRKDHTKNPKLISARSLRSSRNSATSGPAFDTPFKSRICTDVEKSHSDFVSREDHTKNPKLISARSSRSSRNSATSGPAFDTPFDSRICADAENSHSDFVFGSNSKIDNEESPVELSSNDSIPRTSPKTAALSGPAEDKGEDEKLRDEETFEKIHRGKFPNRHAQSLRMLKDLLSNQGISVDGVKKGARGRDAPGASRTLFEKLAILTEAAPDHRDTERERSVSSFTDAGSESVTSCARSMRDAGEQCTIRNESSVVLPTRTGSEGSCDSPRTEEARAKEVSSVCTEIDEDYRRTIYVDASVSSAPSAAELGQRSCEVAETQTLRNAADKDSTTEEIIASIAKPTSNAFTETEQKSSASKEANTEDTGPEISDAASQFDPSECSTEVASGKDFADTECPSMCVNTEPPDVFVKSRGVCFRGPRKIDGDSQCNSENSKETASGRDYVGSNGVSEYVNTDRQDYLFEDRSVEVLLPQTTEEACQVDPPSSIVDTAVGDHSLDFGETKSSMRREERLIAEVTTDRGRSLETVVVKDVDVVQWQSSTTFETSRINCSTCSSNSSVVAWRPVARCSQRSAAEKIRSLRERVPKEAITALEIASERARNLYKAIGIYRENLVSRKVNESIVKYCESEYTSQIDGPICQAIAPCAKPCSFHEKSKIKSLLEANLKKSFELSHEPSNLPIRPVDEDADRSKLREEIASLVDDLLKDAVRDIGSEAEDKNIVPEERFLQPKKRQNPRANVREGSEEKNRHEEVNLPSKNGNTSDFRLISRNSLLTFIYGTVCSLVFWALQFSISCDSR